MRFVSFCLTVTAGYDWSPDWVWFVNLCKGIKFMADLVLGIAIFLSFHQYGCHGRALKRLNGQQNFHTERVGL